MATTVEHLETRASGRDGAGAGVLQRILATDASATTLLLRVVLAAVIWPHGAQHLPGWFGGYGFAGTHAWMTGDVGIPPVLATLGILAEFFMPLALFAGLGGRAAALVLAVFLTTAATTHAEYGFFMNWSGQLPAGAEGFEYHILAVAIAVTLVVRGSGAWSVDRLLAARGRRVR